MRDPSRVPRRRRTANALAAAAAQRIAAFRRQRPLRAGSLIITLFGDALVPRGGAIGLGSLIELARPFGINERLVRTASARLAQAGWLETRRLGKRSEYRLSASGRERFAEATVRIYGPTPPWSGRWTLLLPPPLPARERRELRQALIYQGFGELAPGLYAHAELSRQGIGRALASFAAAIRESLVFEATLGEGAAPRMLIERGWNLGELAHGYRRFVKHFEPALAAASDPVDPPTGFVLRTLLIHEYRRLHLRDPLLPAALLPADWPGARAAALCARLYAALLDASETHLTAIGARLDGALPPADASVRQRFGGLALRRRPEPETEPQRAGPQAVECAPQSR